LVTGNAHILILPVMAFNVVTFFDLGFGRDLILSASYITYSALIWKLWRRGPDAVTQCRLQQTQVIRHWMLATVAVMLTMCTVDGVIAFAFVYAGEAVAKTYVSIGAVFGAFVTVILFAVRSRAAGSQSHSHNVSMSLEPNIRRFLTEHNRFSDPELTLDKLAKRMHLPSRKISTSINHATGMNVSQYINSLRLEYAVGVLDTTDLPVARVGEMSGFLTRSNFYREFQRVYGQSPAAYRNRAQVCKFKKYAELALRAWSLGLWPRGLRPRVFLQK